MSWKNMTIGKKIATGFGIVLALLVLASVLSYTGVGGIVHNAKEVIGGNKLDGNLAQKEVDHLNWANKICSLLTSKTATKLEVQTDDHKCAFGKWLYGEGRKQAEAMVPALAPMFKAVEAPHHRLHESAVGIGQNFKQADDKLPALLTSKVVDHLKWASKIKDTLLENLPALKVQTDDHACSLGKWLYSPAGKKAAASDPELASLLAALEKPHHQLHNSAKAIEKAYRPIHPGLAGLLKDRLDDHRRWVQQVAVGIMTGKKKLGVETDPAKCGLGKFINSAQGKKYMADFPALKEAAEALAKPHEALHKSAVDIEKALAQGDTMQAQVIFDKVTVPSVEQVASYLQAAIDAEDKLVKGQEKALEIYNTQTLPALEKTQALINKLVARAEKMLAGKNEANRIFSDQTTPALKETQALLHKIRAEARKHIMTDEVMLSAAQSTERNVTVVGVVAVIIGILLAWVIVRGITKVLRAISDTLGAGADQVAAAANEVSASSQSLAEGASEQAASLEETTSSMEEMSSMTKSNADNASQADSLMDEAKAVVGRAGESMGLMAESMSHISDAGEEISKIVKSIDEIAFQTNLLALNAAVEAARAGEAGAGFAVVADEVRNLAMRAADAAKNTQTLVEGTVTRINQGSELVDKTQNEFTQVTESAGKVAGLVSEIAAASGEQAEGIDQVNKAMVQMDQVVQVSAANSEEGASAAEELNAQAVVMKDTVAELLALVGGRQGGGKAAAKSAGSKKSKASKKAHEDHPALPRPGAKEVKPEEAIPFDDDDFSDF